MGFWKKFGNAESQRGDEILNADRCDDALASYDRALEIKPKDASTGFYRANVLYKLGRYDDLINSVDKALTISPNFTEYQQLRNQLIKK